MKKIIGFVVPNISNFYYASLASTLGEDFKKKDYQLIIVESKQLPENELDHLNFLSGIADGIILSSVIPDYASIEEVVPPDYPIVFIERKPSNAKGSIILVNNYLAIYQSVLSLIADGHKKIGCIAPHCNLSLETDRVKAYKDAMQTSPLGFHPEWIRYNEENDIRISTHVGELLNIGCTSILACNHMITMDAFDYIHSVSTENQPIHLSGFCDFGNAGCMENSLNLVVIPTDQVAHLASQQMIYSLKHPDHKTQEFILKSTLHARTLGNDMKLPNAPY